MLQQTQVDTVIPYYRQFLERFPTSKDLANADLQDVLKAWEGLGYYARARYLYKTAVRLHDEHNGELPELFDDLKKLPGFGDYTAAAVASIAFNQPVPAVDGNCFRVISRFWGIEDLVDGATSRKTVRSRLEPLLKTFPPSIFNQSIMELGALVCRPRKPLCGQCPIAEECVARQRDMTELLPRKRPRKTLPLVRRYAGIVWNQDKFLIVRRPDEAMLGGLWTFPQVERINGENPDELMSRYIGENFFISVIFRKVYGEINHTYSHFKLNLVACGFSIKPAIGIEVKLPYYDAEPAFESTVFSHVSEDVDCGPRTPGHTGYDDIRWSSPDTVGQLPFDKASLKVLEKIRTNCFEGF